MQYAEAVRQRGKWRAIAQRTGLALYNTEIVAPIVDGSSWRAFLPIKDADVLCNDMCLRHNDQACRINPQANRPIGEAGRNAVAIVFEGDKAGRGDSLAMLDKAVEGDWHRHHLTQFIV